MKLIKRLKTIKEKIGGENDEAEGIGKDQNGWYKQYQKYFKNAALIIAIFLFYNVLSKTDQTFTSLVTDKDSMLKLYMVIVLIGYYIGGTPAALKTVAIVGVAFYLIPVFFQTTPKQIASKVASIIQPSAVQSDNIVLDSGIYNFLLGPGETNDKWITTKDEYDCSFSSSTANDPVLQSFFLIYRDGKMIKVDRADVIIPPNSKPFKLMGGGEKGAYVKLLVFKKI